MFPKSYDMYPHTHHLWIDICLILVFSLPTVVFPSSAIPLEIPALPDMANQQKQCKRAQSQNTLFFQTVISHNNIISAMISTIIMYEVVTLAMFENKCGLD